MRRWPKLPDMTNNIHGDRPVRKPRRLEIPRTAIPEQPAKLRATNFDEVTLGYDQETAILEASRCIQCKKPKCVEGCPVGIDIGAFIKLIGEGDPAAAIAKLKETTSFPSACGRVCPQ